MSGWWEAEGRDDKGGGIMKKQSNGGGKEIRRISL